MCAEMEKKHKQEMAKMTLEIGMIKGDREMIIEDALSKVPPQIIKTPEQERDDLESLKDNERLDISAIKGFDEIKKTLMDTASKRVQTPAKAFKIHTKDCTSQCDGSNKTFNVGGSHFGIIGVFGTQFPLIYRPVIDYTETSTGFTLTAAVTAPDTSQTLIAQFLK
mgnify:CR=1 FL=1